MIFDKYYYKEYHKNRRNKYVQYLGGECVKCGSTDNLEFDHIDPKQKRISIGKILHYKPETIFEELEKCQLLCKSCHDDKTYQEVLHGSRRKYRLGCRCLDCKLAESSYQKSRRCTQMA